MNNSSSSSGASRPPSEQILGRTIIDTEEESCDSGGKVCSEDLTSDMTYDLDATTDFSLSNMTDQGRSFNQTAAIGDCSLCSGGSATPMAHGGANLFRQFILSRKTTTCSGGVAIPAGGKLKKIRVGGGSGSGLSGHGLTGMGILGSGNNNVMLAKPELSAVEILEKISESLTKHSIRFTLKRLVQLCSFIHWYIEYLPYILTLSIAHWDSFS